MCKNVVRTAQAEDKASREAYAEIVEPIYDKTDRQFSQQFLKLVVSLPYRTEVDESEYSTLSFSDPSEEFTSSISSSVHRLVILMAVAFQFHIISTINLSLRFFVL